MIIVRIYGGLGNQMFQYAIGKHLALKNNTSLYLDIENFAIDKLRVFVLPKLKCNYLIASQDQILKQKYGIYNKISIFILKLLNKLTTRIIGKSFFQRKGYIKETGFAYEDKLLKIREDAYLDGYWQSEKYFLEIRELLLKEFTPNKTLLGENKKLAKRISSSNSVSIHIRRGDYVNNSFYANCSLDYYQNAVKLIGQKLAKPHFFIFSDDLEWVKMNIRLPFKSTIVDTGITRTDYEDLKLMSMCKHNIIANSSFSWWAAWLNSNKNKVVIAPKCWFKSNLINTSDLIPSAWKTLANDSC